MPQARLRMTDAVSSCNASQCSTSGTVAELVHTDAPGQRDERPHLVPRAEGSRQRQTAEEFGRGSL